MTLLTSWISVLMAFLLLLYFWRAKVYASGNSEEEIDFTYVIIGVTLGAFLAISFIALIICMVKNQIIDSALEESDGRMDRRTKLDPKNGVICHVSDSNILQLTG
ncbi:transmembrane protein 273 [Chlamydotis macqueenii]